MVMTGPGSLESDLSPISPRRWRRWSPQSSSAPYRLAQAPLPVMREEGSITFFSGVLSGRPGVNVAGLAAVNGAAEGLRARRGFD